MRRLLKYLRGYEKECILGPFFKLLEASFELIVPLVMASIIDEGIALGDRGHIYRMCGVLLLLAAVGLTASITAQYFAARAATGFAAKVRYALFSHVESLSFSELDAAGTSTLITRMTSDINQVQNGVNLVLRLFLRSPFVVVGAMLMAFTVDVRAAMVFVVAIPLLSVVIFGVMAVTMPLFRKVQQGLDAILGRTRENLAGVRVIRAFNKESEETERFAGENDALTNIQLLVGRISGLTNPLTYIIINYAIIAVIWLGAGQVYEGILTQGEVIALVSYMSQILVELVKLANLIINITKSLACADRVADVFEMNSSLTIYEEGAEDEPKGRSEKLRQQETAEFSEAGGRREAVRFEHVSMTYAGASGTALHEISFSVERGQTVGIIGGTGSGKTSLVHLIPRFYDVSEGAVFVDGIDVRQYPLEKLRAKIGIVMQKAVLFSGTIEENLRWGNPSATEEELWQALRIAQAVDVGSGLGSMIEEGGKNLSGGQRQRLTIARAIVRNPEILILDDSASALDFATDARLRMALRELEDMTVFIVSQRTSSIRQADQILVLDDGEAVDIGTHEELLERCEVYGEIHESQM